MAGLGIAFAPTFEVVLVALLIMGMSDGISIVAEQGIMMRRSPDAVRSRVMAGFDALLSLGIAVAYVFAGPVLERLGPKGVYGVGGVSAAVAAVLLLPDPAPSHARSGGAGHRRRRRAAGHRLNGRSGSFGSPAGSFDASRAEPPSLR